MEKNFFDHLIHEFDTPLTNPILVFSLILFIILFSPILLRKIRIPGIIGLILSGVVIGPYGLNILVRNSAVDLFSTIGLLYIMFIAGLELDLNDFQKNKYKSLWFGFFTFIFPLSIGFPVCYYLLGFDLSQSVLTASMFATHTLIAYPIVSKFGISKNEAVAITVGGTILTDTAVLIILAIVIGSTNGGLNQEFWFRLVTSLAIFSAIMFFIIPRIAKWFFSRLESEKTSHYIFVLSIVFFAAFLAEVAGVEPIIGAFVAGLALNPLIPHSSALMNRIEFIGNAIFIPFFLISVGMLVDVSVILRGPSALIIAGTLTVVALTGKWVAAIITRIVFKYSKAQGQLIFGLSSAHAAATLAVILVGFNAGVIDENVLNGTIILILVTCVFASFATEIASRKIVLNAEDENLINYKTYLTDTENILLPIANLGNMEALLDFATLIKDKNSAIPITVLSVVPHNEQAEANLLKARKSIDSSVKLASASETNVNVIATIDHNFASGIARVSKEVLADIILLGWPKKENLVEKLLGGKSESLLNGTDKNIIISYFEKPLVAHKRIFVVCPPLAELEVGFNLWLSKLSKLATELSLPVVCYCEKRSEEAIIKNLAQQKYSPKISFEPFEEWDDISQIFKLITPDDLIIFVSARLGAVSHHAFMDRIPERLEKNFRNFTKIIIYPMRHDYDHTYEEYDVIH